MKIESVETHSLGIDKSNIEPLEIGVYWNGDIPFLIHTMSCGHQVTLVKGQTVPKEDVMCSCGNPNHFAWKFSK